MNQEELLYEDFFSGNEKRLADLDHCSDETLINCYHLFEKYVKEISKNIAHINPMYRVKLCQQMDTFLNVIAERIPFSIQVEGNIFTPAIQGARSWRNVELMKDKGLTGYMLGKHIGAKSHMFFCSAEEDYSFAEDLPGLSLLKSEKIDKDSYFQHLSDHYAEIDILILHGIYLETFDYLDRYRELRPDGKVYCALDMNVFWMGKIGWADPMVQNFFNQCDLVATSSSYLRDVLNGNPDVNFPCRFIPNGFYNATHIPIAANIANKTNTILTVGRIGTKQKNNEELLLGFAKIAHFIPTWNLKLVGEVEPTFYSFLERYFDLCPQLKNRIIVTGPIHDKKDLYREYAVAKVFALTSGYEGGTPNVYAEALFHGCKFVTSDIDGAIDITNDGSLGYSYHLGDINELATALLKLCHNEDTDKDKAHIESAVAYGKKQFLWEHNAKKLAFSLFFP